MLRYVCFFMFVIFLNACATLPKDISKTPSYAVEIQGDTRIGKAVEGEALNHPDESGFYMQPSDCEMLYGLPPLSGGIIWFDPDKKGAGWTVYP